MYIAQEQRKKIDIQAQYIYNWTVNTLPIAEILRAYSMVPIKRTVFLLTMYGMKNTVRLIGTLE